MKRTSARAGRGGPAKAGPGALRFKILLVDDDPDNLLVFSHRLEHDGFVVLSEEGADAGFLAAIDSRPDLILTDVAMPEQDGLAFCRRLKGDRRTAGIPVIMMSGVHTREDEQLEGYEQGADDYLPKSYPPRLLAAKIRALLRRYASPEDLGEVLRAEGLDLDVSARTVAYQGKKMALTRKEFDLLTTFLRKAGSVLSHTYLLETVWGYDPADYNDPRTIQVHISSLRRKLGAKLGARIANVPGLGYRFEAK